MNAAIFKRKPQEAPTSYKDAAAYAARTRVRRDSRPGSDRVDEVVMRLPSSAWATVPLFYAPSEFDYRYTNEEVGILSQKLPHAGISDDWARSTWLSILRIDIRTDRKLVKEIEALIAPRVRWAEGVTTRHAPVRLSATRKQKFEAPQDNSSILMPFRLYTDRYYSPTAKTRGFRLPKDGQWDNPNEISVTTAYDCFVPTRFEWRDALDLRAVHRDALPLMDQDTADEIIADVEQLLEARGVETT